MLMVIVLFLLFEGIIYLASLPFRKTIKTSSNVDECIKARKRLRVVKILLTIFLLLLLIGILCWIYTDNNFLKSEEMRRDFSRDIGLIIFYTIFRGGWQQLKGHINAYSKKEYLAKNPKGYVLFLRAFNDDDYGTVSPGCLWRKGNDTFEHRLSKAVKRICHYKMCAVGMTKEVDAPYGADRVYVSDLDWQDDVKELMQKAKMIFILLRNRESCLWEIGQSSDLLHKTCFIIDGQNSYEQTVSKLGGRIIFPEYDDIIATLKDNQVREEMKFHRAIIGLMILDNQYLVFKTTCNDVRSLVENAKQQTLYGKTTLQSIGTLKPGARRMNHQKSDRTESH